MTNGEQSAQDIETLALYEGQSRESELLMSIMDLIDIYSGEIKTYLKKGTYEELTDFVNDLNATSVALTAEITHLVAQLTGSEAVSEVISTISDLCRRINNAYMSAVCGTILCESCADARIDIDVAHWQMYDALSDLAVHDYNPEKAAIVFNDGVNSMNAHLLHHLSHE